MFGGDGLLGELDDDLACLFSVARPVNDAASARAVLLELFEIGVEVRHRVLADALAGEAKLLPVAELRDDTRTLVLNDRGRVMQVLAELSVAQEIVRGLGEGGRRCADRAADRSSSFLLACEDFCRCASYARCIRGDAGRRRCASGNCCRRR